MQKSLLKELRSSAVSLNTTLAEFAKAKELPLIVNSNGVLDDGDFEELCKVLDIDYEEIIYKSGTAVIFDNTGYGLVARIKTVVNENMLDSYFDFD